MKVDNVIQKTEKIKSKQYIIERALIPLDYKHRVRWFFNGFVAPLPLNVCSQANHRVRWLSKIQDQWSEASSANILPIYLKGARQKLFGDFFPLRGYSPHDRNFSMVFKATITIEWNGWGQPSFLMGFRWLSGPPSIMSRRFSIVVNGQTMRCDGPSVQSQG